MSQSKQIGSWEKLPLEECLDFVIGGDWGKAPEYEDGDFIEVKCIRGAEFKQWKQNKGKTSSLRKIKKSSLVKRELKEGDILLEISGGGPDQPVGRTELIDRTVLNHGADLPKVPTNFLRLIRPVGLIDSAYLNYFLKNFYKSGEVINYQSGSNNLRNLQFKDYVKIAVEIPPLNEQTRIANKLDELLAQVDTIKARVDAIPTILKRFRQSVLAAAVSGKLTEEWRGENSISTSTWETHLSNSVCLKITDGEHQTPKRTEKGGVLLSAKNIRDGYIDYDKHDFISEADFEKCLKRCNAEIGDVLIVSVGATIGRTAIKREDVQFALVRSVGLFKVNPEKVLGEYFLFNLQSPSIQQHIQEVSRGNAQPTLYIKAMTQIPIQLPSLEEQKQIVQRVEQLFAFADQIEQRVKEAQTRIDKLSQSILAKAFRGELVPQDPNDEPASELLERIKQEREEAAKKVGKSKK